MQRLVVKSSTSVYGSAPRDPAVFTETTPPKSLPSGGFAKDAVEVEGYVRGFARRRPDVAVCVLRFANILGPSADSPLAEYFSLPVLPTVLGYDPRLQFVHEDDVIEVLRIASHEPRRGTLNSGTFNIAGDGVLLLSQMLAAARPAHGAAAAARGDLGGLGAASVGHDGLLAGADPAARRTAGSWQTTQMRETLGFQPKYTTAETFADFARSRGPGLLPPEALARAVDRLAGAARTRRPARRSEELIHDGGRQGHSVRRGAPGAPEGPRGAGRERAQGRRRWSARAGGAVRRRRSRRCPSGRGRAVPGRSGSRAGWPSCGGGSPATTRSTTSATTRS